MNSIDRLRELGKHTEPCIWTADDVKSAVMIEKETFDKCLDNIELEVECMVPLPVDADGDAIHVGDVMEWIDIEGEVTLTCEVDAVGVECFFAWDKANGRYAQKSASAYRHHHAPTVEDVLYESLRHFGAVEERTPEVDEWLHEQAARLRLKED